MSERRSSAAAASAGMSGWIEAGLYVLCIAS
jgi:hypothetical protein